jgi:hypothetical protein
MTAHALLIHTGRLTVQRSRLYPSSNQCIIREIHIVKWDSSNSKIKLDTFSSAKKGK